MNIMQEILTPDVVMKGIDLAKYAVDKNAETSIYHDNTMKDINTQDNDGKTNRLKLVLEVAVPLVTAGVLYLNTKSKQ